MPTRLPGGRASHWHAGGAPLAATAACGDPGPGTGICVGQWQWQGRGRRLADSASASFGQLPAPDAAARCCRAPYTSARAGRPSRQQGTSRHVTFPPGANPAPACCSYRARVASVDRGGLLKLRFVLFGSNFQVAGVRRIIIRPECALLSRVRSGCSRTTHTSTAAAAGHARSKDPASDIARRQGAGTRIHNQVRAPHTHRSAHGHSAQGHPSLTSDVMPVASGPSGATPHLAAEATVGALRSFWATFARL